MNEEQTVALEQIFAALGDGPDEETLVDTIDTDYGFLWGPMEVVRAATVLGKGGRIEHFVLTVATEREEVHIFVTPGGRSIKVANKFGQVIKVQDWEGISYE